MRSFHTVLVPLLWLVTAPLAHAEAPAPTPTVESTAALRARLATHRAEQLARLQAYADAGKFPVNPDVAPSAASRWCAPSITACASSKVSSPSSNAFTRLHA